MGPAPVGEDSAVPDEQAIQTMVVLKGDGTCIARARHLAAGLPRQGAGEYGLPVSQRAMDLTQLVVSELVTNAHQYRRARR